MVFDDISYEYKNKCMKPAWREQIMDTRTHDYIFLVIRKSKNING